VLVLVSQLACIFCSIQFDFDRDYDFDCECDCGSEPLGSVLAYPVYDRR